MTDSQRVGLGMLALALGGPAAAADHNEATGTQADHAADIDDVYVWHTTDGKVVVIVTFGGPGGEADQPLAGYDEDVLYGVHVDTTGDNVADRDVWVRFGQDADDDWGVQFVGIPGTTAAVEGAVGTALDAGNGLQAQAGVFDDPFFFDLQGLKDTLATGTVSFSSARDSFAGKNVNALVFTMDAASLGATTFKVWATTGRKP